MPVTQFCLGGGDHAHTHVTHQRPLHLQIFYKGMLDYLPQETVDQILPRLSDLLQINGENETSNHFVQLVSLMIELQLIYDFDCFPA